MVMLGMIMAMVEMTTVMKGIKMVVIMLIMVVVANSVIVIALVLRRDVTECT